MRTIKDLMNNEELLRGITEDLEDFDENAEVTYEVWAIGYNESGGVTDSEMLIGEYDNPDEAIEQAKNLCLADIVNQAAEEDDGFEPAEDICYISLEVETVVEDDEEGTMNVGTIYKRDLWIDGEYGSEDDFESNEDLEPIVAISADDYVILEDGTLKVKCELLKDFNKNDIIKFQFVAEDEPCIFTYKIMSKVMYEDGDYYHCDFIW